MRTVTITVPPPSAGGSSPPTSATTSSTSAPLSQSPGSPTTWTVDVDSLGAFCHPVAPPFPPRDGNYRLVVGDTLIINLPAGSLVNQNDVRLVLVDGIGEESLVLGTTDCLGNIRYEWVAPKGSCGPCSFCFDYFPFAGTSSHPSNAPPTRRKSGADLVLHRQSSVSDAAGLPKRLTGVVNWVIVSPRICINGKCIPVEALSIQTIVSRCVGPLDTWISRMKPATADLHYNCIHFTPVQRTGESGSCYSLADQLELAPEILPAGSKTSGWDVLKTVVEQLETRYDIMSTSDIVLNHTANNTHWIPHHPECGYNERNSPHLVAAIELDIALQNFSVAIAEGHLRGDGLSEVIEDEPALKTLRRLVYDRVLGPLKLGEWFEIDMDGAINQFRNASSKPIDNGKPDSELRGLLYNECVKTVGVARKRGVCPDGDVTSRLCKSDVHLKSLLRQVQEDLYREAGEVSNSILNAVEGYVRWERLQCRKGPITTSHWNALVPRYFTPIVTKSGETLHLANNGWVMDWNAEKDFAAPGALVYLKRSLVAWSDCIKLRYGDGPEDCPFLWSLMRDYCANTAKIFNGIRLDNCHSTPMHVAKYCLTEARKANPNLWVYAELFTGKRETDMKFERELGLNALIREAMQSFSGGDLSYHIGEFGGRPIGGLDPIPALNRLMDAHRPFLRTLSPSLYFDCTHDNETPQQKRTAIDALPNAAAVAASASAIGSVRGYDELIPRVLSVVTEKRHYHYYDSDDASTDTDSKDNGVDIAAQARFCTSLHAGSSSIIAKGSWDEWKGEIELIRRHGVWTADLPSAYYPETEKDFVSYQYKFVANGKDWFFDPALPHARDQSGTNINNILSIGTNPSQHIDQRSLKDARQWNSKSPSMPGMMEARKVLNELHHQLAMEGFDELEVKCLHDDIIIVKRHDPTTHRMCYFFIHTAFTPAVIADPKAGGTYEINGSLDEVVLEARLIIPEDAFFVDEPNYINGLPSRCQVVSHSKDIHRSKLNFFDSRYDDRTDTTYVTMTTAFLPGSVFVLMTTGYPHIHQAVANAIQDIDSIAEGVPGTPTISRCEELHAFSYILYSCADEEKDRSGGTRGCYAIPGLGALPYAGIAGIISELDKIRYSTDDFKKNPLISNVTDGDWYLEYSADRLDTDKDDAFSGGAVVVLLKVASWLREVSADALRYLPRNLVPSYVDWIISSLYSWTAKRLMAGMPEPLRSCKDPFMIRLAIATLQFYSYVPSSPLIHGTNHPSLSAGLPHFSTNYMRAWGRDTFIAFKGCLLTTGRYQEAREEILGFARVMRHGLIPNLLDSGNNPRFNARDATWFFLQSIQDYCCVAPEGTDFLKASVSLKYSEALPEGVKVETISDLMHFILSQHAKGIEFREWNAGTKIDSCMKDEGFNIKIQFDPDTGLIFGGNRSNCGTWMDKMGSSIEAGNMGVPATPRDGAAVEIIGLLKSTLRFVSSLSSTVWDHDVANDNNGLTYKQWNELLLKSFEPSFYIGSLEENKNNPSVDLKLVNKTQIVRDSLKASDAWRDYQLRPNFCIALSVAPELMSKEHALAALETASKELFCAKTPTHMQHIADQFRQRFNTDEASELLRMMINVPTDICKPPPVFGRLLPTTQLGLKTLDASDYNYRPVYDNDDRSLDTSIAHGFNYHNGPEWVWPVGYFLDAIFTYTKEASSQKTTEDVALREACFNSMRYLLYHREFVPTTPWLSLPELTNANAEFCRHSCHAQAWSIGTILAFLGNIASVSSSRQALPRKKSHTAQTSSTSASPAETLSENSPKEEPTPKKKHPKKTTGSS